MKREPLGDEHDQDRWLGNSLRQPATPPSEACPDAETLAAWADGGLNAQAAAAVELHASTCARCLAVAAAMERSAPAVSATRAWTPARAVRWLIPLTAAATAVAIWVVVPQRSVVDDLKMTAPAAELSVREPAPDRGKRTGTGTATGGATGTETAEAPRRGAVTGSTGARPEFAPDLSTQNQNPAPTTENREPPSPPQEQMQLRDQDLRRERGAPAPQQFAVEAPPAAPQSAPQAPAAAPAPPATQAAPPSAADAAAAKGAAEAAPSLTADTFAETLTTTQRSAFTPKFVVTAEAKVPKNELIRWRVIANATIERSLDGGKTWIKTVPLPRDSVKGLTITGIRAMSDQTAIVQLSNGTEFLTSNGGMSWIQLQEK